MEYILRKYQQDAVMAALSFFRNDKIKHNSIMMLPTGSGKSLIIAAIVKELNEPTIIFQPSKEILEQNLAKLKSYGYTAGVYSASYGEKNIQTITFATIGSCYKKVEYFRRFKYIIVDECHYVNSKNSDTMYNQFINSLRIKVLGLTATPYRLTSDGWGGSILKFITRTRPRIFKDVIYYIQNKDLFDAGYLSKMEYVNIGGFDQEQIKKNTTGADFDDNSLQKYFNSIDHNQRIIDVIVDLQGKRTGILCFTKFVADAEYLQWKLGGNSVCVFGDTHKKLREQYARDFRSGKIKVVFVVGCWVTGFDYPELDTIIEARPTMSLALYYQMIGRGIRPHKSKEYCLVVDLCDNFSKFGKLEDLWLHENNGKPFISSNERQLTNAYFDEDKPLLKEPEPVTFPFGKYKGMVVAEIAKIDMGYIRWMNREVQLRGDLKKEIDKIIEEELQVKEVR